MQKNFENGQNSGVQLQLVAKYASLVVLLLVGGGGGSVSSDGKCQKNAEHDTKKHTVNYLIFLTLYQHLGSKGSKFCVL